jgi:hypothetical protein
VLLKDRWIHEAIGAKPDDRRSNPEQEEANSGIPNCYAVDVTNFVTKLN